MVWIAEGELTWSSKERECTEIKPRGAMIANRTTQKLKLGEQRQQDGEGMKKRIKSVL